MGDARSRLAVSAALVFIGAAILVAGAATSSRSTDEVQFAGWVVGFIAFLTWVGSYREASAEARDENARRALERAIETHGEGAVDEGPD